MAHRYPASDRNFSRQAQAEWETSALRRIKFPAPPGEGGFSRYHREHGGDIVWQIVDGAEGGTGAGPLEFLDHVGMPLRDGLMFIHNALVGLGIREQIKLGASGKIITAFDMIRLMALGADWCNSARGFMFTLGCIQSMRCHTDQCPTGVATQDPIRQRALVIPEKARRVASFHRATIAALAEVVAAAGIDHPAELRPHHIWKRSAFGRVETFDQIFNFLGPGELLSGTDDPRFRDAWARARADSFSPA